MTCRKRTQTITILCYSVFVIGSTTYGWGLESSGPVQPKPFYDSIETLMGMSNCKRREKEGKGGRKRTLISFWHSHPFLFIYIFVCTEAGKQVVFYPCQSFTFSVTVSFCISQCVQFHKYFGCLLICFWLSFSVLCTSPLTWQIRTEGDGAAANAGLILVSGSSITDKLSIGWTFGSSV